MSRKIEQAYLWLIKKASRSWFFSLCLTPLAALSFLFFVGVVVRRWILLARGRKRSLVTPVVTIGNVTVGGTGKTPFLALLLKHINGRIGLVTRGYRRQEKGLCVTSGVSCTPMRVGDEAYLIGRRFPDVTIAAGESKWEAVEKIDGQCDIIFLDDGLQRYDIPVSLKIATIDCGGPDGYGWLLPRGLLREPFSWLRYADILVITNANDALSSVRDSLKGFGRPIIVTKPAIEGFFGPDGSERVLVQGQKVALFSGIAKPEGFRRSMEQAGYRVVDHLIFPDHGDIIDEELRGWIEKVRSRFGEVAIVGTEKDWARREKWLDSDVCFSEMNLEVVEGQEEFRSLCQSIHGKVKYSENLMRRDRFGGVWI